jgi:hypothetical protein
MIEFLLIIILLLVGAVLFLSLRKGNEKPDTTDLEKRISDEFARSRVENNQGSKGVREELTNQITRMSDVQNKQQYDDK